MRVEGRSEVYEEFLTGRELEYQKAAERQYPVTLAGTDCAPKLSFSFKHAPSRFRHRPVEPQAHFVPNEP